MFKLFGGFILGVFVGAVCVEVLSRVNPALAGAINDRAKETVDRFCDA